MPLRRKRRRHLLCTLVFRFILANCLLLNLLCCALESRPSCSSMHSITCIDVTVSCRTHILWIHHLCSYASCSALRPWKPTQLSYLFMLLLTIALHYIAACKPVHPLLGPLCLALHCKNSGGFWTWPPVVVLRDKQWFQTTSVTPLVLEKHQWWSESNTVLQCTPSQTLYTSLSTLAMFKLPISRMRQSAAVHAPWCTPDCSFWLFRCSPLALQSRTWMFAYSMVVYMYSTWEHVAGMGI